MTMENPVAASSSKTPSDDDRQATQLQRATRARQRQALDLQRENILSQRTSNPSRRAALEAALTQIESQIQALE